MVTNSKRRFRGTSGLLSLEASIALTLFIFLMLFMFSFLVVFEARNQVAHVMLSTADSLSKDPLANEAPADDDIVQELLYGLYNATANSHGTYTDSSKWYDSDETVIQETIKARFIAYIAGGDKEEADRILRGLNIVDGIEGLDFSGSCVADGNLYLNISYKIEYEFQVFGLEPMSMSQSCCSKLWK